jgi:hypothetical protein
MTLSVARNGLLSPAITAASHSPSSLERSSLAAAFATSSLVGNGNGLAKSLEQTEKVATPLYYESSGDEPLEDDDPYAAYDTLTTPAHGHMPRFIDAFDEGGISADGFGALPIAGPDSETCEPREWERACCTLGCQP